VFHLCLYILLKYHIQIHSYVFKYLVLLWFINIAVLFLGNFLTKTDTKYICFLNILPSILFYVRNFILYRFP